MPIATPMIVNPEAASLAIVAAVNRPQVLAENLALSPMVKSGGVELIVESDHATPGLAYNAGLDRTNAEVVIFAHQDVYLPADWERQLREAMRWLNEQDPNWAVLGPTGRGIDNQRDTMYGRVWSRGIYREIGEPINQPIKSSSLDEMVLVLRRNSGLRFDPALPSYHLYGTDIILEAQRQGYHSYVIPNPAVHNSEPVRRLDQSYGRAYHYMKRKWPEHLPYPTCIVPLSRWNVSLWRLRLRMAVRRLLNADIQRESKPGPQWARQLGYESED